MPADSWLWTALDVLGWIAAWMVAASLALLLYLALDRHPDMTDDEGNDE